MWFRLVNLIVTFDLATDAPDKGSGPVLGDRVRLQNMCGSRGWAVQPPESAPTLFHLVSRVPGEGLEPSRPEGPAGLSRLRLPVTPPGRVPQP